MVIRFRVENFYSILDEQELSLSSLTHDGALLQGPVGVGDVVRSVAIYGANASGKSNLLAAMAFFNHAVTHSQRAWNQSRVPITQFASSAGQSRPSRFVLDFAVGEVRYQYGFSTTTEEILEEWLHAFPLGRQQTWFERKAGSVFTFGRTLQRMMKKRTLDTIASLVRSNSLFLSAAAQNNSRVLAPVFDQLSNRWFSVLSMSRLNLAMTVAQHSMSDEALRKSIGPLLVAADLGLTGYEVEEEIMSERQQKVMNAMLEAFPQTDPDKDAVDYKVPRVLFVHRNEGGEQFSLSMKDESEGTISYFALMGPIQDALSKGALLIVDEIESSLHPKLAAVLVDLFNNPVTNRMGAQLVFSTHASSLLSDCHLTKDQIWFTEKDLKGQTKLFPLTDFVTRKADRIEKGYLQGRFGAVPFIDQQLILRMLNPEVTVASV